MYPDITTAMQRWHDGELSNGEMLQMLNLAVQNVIDIIHSDEIRVSEARMKKIGVTDRVPIDVVKAWDGK